MKHFSYHNVLLGIIVFYDTVHISMSCTPEDHKKMQEEWTECSRRVTQEYSTDECQLVGGVIGECGKVWSKCHSSEEQTRMKNLHLKALISQYGSEGELEECQVVQQFRWFSIHYLSSIKYESIFPIHFFDIFLL